MADPADIPGPDRNGQPAALLVEAGSDGALVDAVARFTFDPAAGRHAFGCLCCAGRSPAALAFDLLFRQRVRGLCPWFERVVVLAPSPRGMAMVAAALREDRVAAARFRAT
jgi:hypothetical protein